MGAVRLDSLETHMIQRFYNTLTDKAGKPLSPKTVKNIHGVLHKVLQQAIANGYISQNPAAAMYPSQNPKTGNKAAGAR